MEKLFDTFKQRKRPEDVAQMILEYLSVQLSHDEERLLQRAARFSLKQSMYGYTSMLEDFSNPVGAQRQVASAKVLFTEVPHISEEQRCERNHNYL